MFDLILNNLWLAAFILLALLLIPWTRSIIAWIINTLLTPGVLGTLKVIGSWMLWLVTRIWAWHRIWFLHLITPHDKMFPTLGTGKERIHLKD